MTQSPPRYKRILLKLSGETLLNPVTHMNLDAEVIRNVALQIQDVRDRGVQVALVVGGGNIYRGLSGEKHGISRSQGDYMGMLRSSSVSNVLIEISSVVIQPLVNKTVT